VTLQSIKGERHEHIFKLSKRNTNARQGCHSGSPVFDRQHYGVQRLHQHGGVLMRLDKFVDKCFIENQNWDGHLISVSDDLKEEICLMWLTEHMSWCEDVFAAYEQDSCETLLLDLYDKRDGTFRLKDSNQRCIAIRYRRSADAGLRGRLLLQRSPRLL
jgi:hypothetical protein